MLKQCLLACICCALQAARAETVELKDKTAVTGRILAEKRDQLVVDIGYTVLVIPRDQVVTVSKSEAAEVPAKRVTKSKAASASENKEGGSKAGFFSAPAKSAQVRIIAINKFDDLALLKIEDKEAPKFRYLSLGSADALAVGERVFAIGSPLGLERTVTEGILSTKTRQLAGALYLQTTAQINPGNSGGPLFNMSGEVIGVTNMKITFGEGLGFAIPVESVKFFLEHRDAFAYSNENPSNPYRYLEPPSHTRQTAVED